MRVGVESWPSLLTLAAPRWSSRDASAGAAIVGVGSTGGSGTVGGATSSGAVAAGARSWRGRRWRGHVCGEVGHRLEHRRFEQLRHEVGRARRARRPARQATTVAITATMAASAATMGRELSTDTCRSRSASA